MVIYTRGSLITDLHNIAGVTIGGGVSNYLGAAIGKEDTVLTVGSITITAFVVGIVEFSIVVNNRVCKIVFGGSIGRFVVGWGGLVI